MNPSNEPTAPCAHYCNTVLVDDNVNMIYSDFTGSFPVRSFNGNKYILVVYTYDANVILVGLLQHEVKKK